MSDSTIKKWWEVYTGDEECRFFKVLSRHPKFVWRSIDKIAKDAKISVARAEAIAEKYQLSGQVIQQQKDPTKYAYFLNVEKKAQKGTISKENKSKRVDNASVNAVSP